MSAPQSSAAASPDSRSAAPAATPRRSTRFGLRFKILLGLTLFNIAGTVLFSVNHYLTEKERILQGIRDKLAAAARALPDMLPPGHLDRAVAPGVVSPADYRRIVDQLSAFCNDTGLRYLYTYFKGEKGFYCTSTNGTPKELAEGKFTAYWDLYDSAPPSLSRAWATGQPVYEAVSDQWGRTYTLFLPLKTKAGTRYISGADIPISFLDEVLAESLTRSALIGLGSFVIFFLISFPLSSQFSQRIIQLAAYTRELAGSDFKPDAATPLHQQIVAMPTKTGDEVGQLAHSFIEMEHQLGSYLQELKETTAAKERFQNELKIAGDIQASMLPHAFAARSEQDRIDLHAGMKPAKEAGGDLYDFFYLDDDHLCFAIGDVSDKGMPAALFMVVALTILRARATADLIDRPEEILRQTNELLIPQNQMCQFVTMFLGIVNVRTGEVVYADGGHNRPYHRHASGEARMLPPGGGIALGVMPEAVYKRHTVQLQPGESLVIYTDGVTEAIAADESFYGEKRLETLVAATPLETPASQWVERVMGNVFDFSKGHAQADDITVLVVRHRA